MAPLGETPNPTSTPTIDRWQDIAAESAHWVGGPCRRAGVSGLMWELGPEYWQS